MSVVKKGCGERKKKQDVWVAARHVENVFFATDNGAASAINLELFRLAEHDKLTDGFYEFSGG